MFGKKKDILDEEKTTLEPLNHGETIIEYVSDGYLFVREDGIVRFRLITEHHAELERNKFVEPEPRKNPDPLGRIF